jgi:hypothetical protein
MGFLINAKELIHISGLLLLSLLFMIIPAVLIALNWDTYHLTKIQSLFLVIVPLIFLNYIYYITMGLPVGFTDVYSHMLQCQQSVNLDGVIQFSERLSFNFVALYIIFNFLMATSNLNIMTLASIIPPFFNLIIIVTVYLLVKKLHSHKVALIAMLFYGWENQTLIFGHEFRTQTLGTLLLLMALFIGYSNFKKSSSTIILIIILFSSAMSSFVSIFFTSVVFFVMLVTSTIVGSASKWQKTTELMTWRLLGLYLISCLFYIKFISGEFNNLIYTIRTLFNQMLKNTEATKFSGNQLVQATGEALYGNVVQISSYVLWGLFLLFSMFYLVMILTEKKRDNLKFFASFSALLLCTFINIFTGVLSLGRLYTIAFILIATTLACGLFKLQDISKKTQFKYASKIFTITIILGFVIVSIMKLPNYIIGETNPIRSETPIDFVTYWNSDILQYSVNEFISSYAPNQFLYIYVPIQNYLLLQQKRKNIVGGEKLSILQDKFYGDNYTYRDQILKYQMFKNFDKIYSNKDYIVGIEPL